MKRNTASVLELIEIISSAGKWATVTAAIQTKTNYKSTGGTSGKSVEIHDGGYFGVSSAGTSTYL